MVRKKKKKGSSLLLTVAMFAILSILIMSVLAMTTSGYSLRVKNNKRVESFYAADSGIEISQKLLHEYLGKAIKSAMYAVDEYEKIQPGGKIDQKTKEEKFEEFYKDVVIKGNGSYKDQHGTTINVISAKDYVEDSTKYDDFKRDHNKTINIATDLKSLDGTGGNIASPTNPYKDIKKFLLTVNSDFEDKDRNKREVAADFEILIPEYGQLLIRAKNSKAPNILDYIVGIDGDYTITTDTTTTVLGDMWVKGKEPGSSATPENKYDGGILVRQPEGSTYGAPEVRWNGKIATNATLGIENVMFKTGDATATEENEVFAKNVTIDNSKTKGGDSTLFGSNTSLHLYNDFLMKGKDNNVKLKNLYGLNDINDYESNWTSKNLKNAQKSSAMIINSEDFGTGSSINISKDLYMLGTSYLDLKGNDYQTGQSTIMNNISRPYTMRDDNYLYQYKSYEDGGIQIATKNKDGKEISLDGKGGKVDLAKKFYETNSDAFKSGITVPKSNVASTGVMLVNGEVVHNTPTAEQMKKATEKQNRFVQEVFYMGSENKYSQKDFWNNKVGESVTGSFDWNEIKAIAAKDHNADTTSKIKDEGGNNRDFIHITTKKTLHEIMTEAGTDGHELGKYGGRWGVGSTDVPHIIFNASDKEIVLKNKGAGVGNLVSETADKITYEVNIGSGTDSPPLLVISKGKITFEPFNGYNHIMLISADNAEIKIPYGLPATVGNYDAGTSEGKRNLINELFKYTLESDKIMGGIGGSIFFGSEEKVTENAIEVSNLIKSKNWTLKK